MPPTTRQPSQTHLEEQFESDRYEGVAGVAVDVEQELPDKRRQAAAAGLIRLLHE